MKQKIPRKIERMHILFGKCDEHICRECKNFERITVHDRNHSKCLVYGNTRSEASDWNGRYTACGMFNQSYTGRNAIEITGAEPVCGIPLPNQMCFFEEVDNE